MMVSLNLILKICAGFSCVCIAGGWLIKIINGIRKPSKDVHKMLNTDKKRLDDHDLQIAEMRDDLKYLVNANNLLIRSMLTVLSELANNNDKDGKIDKAMGDIKDFMTPVEK